MYYIFTEDIMIYKTALLCCLLFSSCSPSRSDMWLKEYSTLLQEGAKEFSADPYSKDTQHTHNLIAQKETEVDALLRTLPMQEQISFLSKYYELRLSP